MFPNTLFFYPLWQRFSQSTVFPYFTLLAWILPLLLFSSGQTSLMAHDEGLYAWRSRMMVDEGDWIAPWSSPHHKTPGPYWLIASSYTLFGVSEFSVRLPSTIFGVLSVLLLYEIGKIILNQKLAWLAGAILTVEFLWLQYCRLGTPDVPMIFLVLLAIWSLIRSELAPQDRYFWGFIAGLSFGLGFLVRSFMIFLPMLALLPYLIKQHRHHRHLTNPMLYLGFAVGLIPTFIWLWLSFQHYGGGSIQELFNFVFRLGSKQRGSNGVIFYLWNVPIKAFPWAFFAIFGAIYAQRRKISHYNLILIGVPLVLFLELSFFSTRLPHYSLILYPFIALLAAVGLDRLGQMYKNRSSLARVITYTFGTLGALLAIAGILALAIADANIRLYAILGLAVGLGWLILPAVFFARHHLNNKSFTAPYWIAGWLLSAWLALAFAGFTGLIENYNPDVKTLIQKPAIAQILHSSPINFVQVGGKTGVLLDFYTPVHGKNVETIEELTPSSYAWIPEKLAASSPTPHRVIDSVQKHQLIQIVK